MPVYLIIGQFKQEKPEILDRFESKHEAELILPHYQQECGADWKIYIEVA